MKEKIDRIWQDTLQGFNATVTIDCSANGTTTTTEPLDPRSNVSLNQVSAAGERKLHYYEEGYTTTYYYNMLHT